MEYDEENDILYCANVGRGFGADGPSAVAIHMDKFRPVCKERGPVSDDEILKELAAGELDVVIDDYNANEVEAGMLVSDGYFDSDMKVLVRNSGALGMMLGSTRLGFSATLIKDPRIRVFVIGFFTTLGLTVLSAFFGFVFAWAILLVRHYAPGFVRSAIDSIQEVIRLLPPPVVMGTSRMPPLSSKKIGSAHIRRLKMPFCDER